jgi:metal-responsive CopG/Arc/MetJ family transcriptional regulator
MKISRLYTMDIENITKLNRIQNKSALVNKAVRKYLKEKESFDVSDLDTKVLISVLYAREGKDSVLGALIEAYWATLNES